MRRCLTNLIGNAMRFASTVWVSAAPSTYMATTVTTAGLANPAYA